jgi:hypothetical protein
MTGSVLPSDLAVLARRVRDRDPEALAGFFDANASRVRDYCLLVCRAELVDEATLAAFVDLLGRIDADLAEVDPVEVLCQATRSAAAGRAEVRVEVRETPPARRARIRRPVTRAPQPACRAMPELLAGIANGELTRRELIDGHLAECGLCRTTATRFRRAEAAFGRESDEAPPDEIRRAWLEIAGRAVNRDDAAPVSLPPGPDH